MFRFQRRSLIAATMASLLVSPLTAQQVAGPQRDKQGEKQHTNRLAEETSPYLLMHAHNPVDWYPWGREALDKAKREKKLIFLSIGYSSCHWCHVMERESFLDKEIAEFLNKHFICIKVDREERPDVDTVYMTSLHVFNQLSGSGRGGGWPLSMFLVPNGEPFFGGTYFPARNGDRGAATGFLTIIKRVNQVWGKEPDKIQQDAKLLTRYVKQQLEGGEAGVAFELTAEVADSAFKRLVIEHDSVYGGFGFDATNPLRPKFPEPSNLLFLIDRIERKKAAKQEYADELKLLTNTLDGMARGGIRDHLGGGFHRYSVDRYWHIPHFEKMLYDNGQLASAYAAAYGLTNREAYRRVVDEMLDYVLREMLDKQGGFYSALDAESEDEEGKFYRWDKTAVAKALNAEEYKLFAEIYGLDEPPNFEDKYYAPQLQEPLSETAKKSSLSEAALDDKLAPLRQRLFRIRAKRPRPLTDTKILTSWNGLMIRGFADAGRIFENPKYIKAAERAAQFVLAELRDKNGRLLRTYGKGQAKLNAYVNDYAFLVDGLIALHRATGDKRWLDEADGLTAMQIKLFWDEDQGAFFFTSDDHESLLARSKSFIDGAQPAGNSVSVQNLVYLAGRLDRPEYLRRARKTVRSSAGLLQRAPAAAPRMLVGLNSLLEKEAGE